MQLSSEQKIQEDGYKFPYHYIPSLECKKFSQTRNLSWGYEYLSYLSFILTKVRKLKFESLLDVGCGDGRFLWELNKKFPEKKLTGIDFSKRAINYARSFNPDIYYKEGNIVDKTTISDEYDIITLIEVLEHIVPEEIHDFLDGVRIHLKNSGRLILTVPSKNIKVRPKHYQHFELKYLEYILSDYFEILEYYFLNKISLRTRVIQDILTNRFFILNNRSLLNLIYRYYKNYLLIGDNKNAKRICLICKKRKAK